MNGVNGIKNFKEEGLYFIPLGGAEQFGVNLNAYVSGGEILVVDCGMGFADERFPGIDLLLPDPTFLEENKAQLQGLIITHAHEDHIGAVAMLWDRLQCPVYASPFTASVLRKKLEERNLKSVPVHIVEQSDPVSIGSFSVQFVSVSHSVPDTKSLIIETPSGLVVHSGDWNLDPHPVTGSPTDSALFKAAGEKGVLAYIGDSTNAGVPGRSGSEKSVEEGLEKEFKACKGRIVVTTFSSNIGRVISIIRAAQKCDRQVGVIGRSFHRMIGCARDCDLLEGLPDFVPEEDLGYLPDDKVVVIVTGSQGESRAALAKMARGDHPAMSFRKGDCVIFSARAIPGNEREINEIKNNLHSAGVEVVSPGEANHVIHVSGHPCREEVAEMFQWLRPQIVVPVHGERAQLEAHAELAQACQVPNVIIPVNGSVIRLAPGPAKIVDHIETDLLAVDPKRIIKADHASIIERRRLQYSGVVHISVALDVRGVLRSDPKVEMIGLIDINNPGEEKIQDHLYDEILELVEDMTLDERLDDHFVSEGLRIGARRFCKHALGVKPNTSVHVMRV